MKKLVVIISAVAIILLGGFYLFKDDLSPNKGKTNPQGDKEMVDVIIRSVDIVSNSVSSFGISKASSFEISTVGEFSIDEIKDNLTFDPPVRYEVTKKSAQSFEVKPVETLVSNTIYVINYSEFDYGKAFQVAEDIQVSQSYPGNEATNLPSSSVIEINFNTDIDMSIESFFTIEPTVEGIFDINGSTLVFMPEELEVNQIYTVSIKEGYSLENRMMEEAYTFSFETGYREDFNSDITYSIKNSISANAPIISINSWEFEDSYQIEIRNALNFDSFEDIYEEFLISKPTIDSIKLPEVFNSKVQPLEKGNNQFVELPKLDDGYYIVKVTGKSINQYVFLQIGPHDIYFNENVRGTLLWVMNKNSDKPVADAEVSINSDFVGVTDEEGIFLGDVKEKIKHVTVAIGKHSYLIDHIGEYDYYDFMGYYHNGNQWSFLYSDREAYQKDDRLEVFGFAKYYEKDTPKKLTLQLKKYFGDEYLQSIDITLDDDNSFTSYFDIEDYDYGYYHIVLVDGETVLSTKNVLVSNYEKPEVIMTAKMEPLYVFTGETVKYSLQANYFNDLPYADMKVSFKFDENNKNRQKITDVNGLIEFEFQPNLSSDSWRPRDYSVDSSSVGIENNYISTYKRVEVFTRDLVLRTDVLVNDETIDVFVKTNQLDLSDYVSGEEESLIGQELDKLVDISITESYYQKNFVETIYDPIHKVSYDKYDYEKIERTFELVTIETIDGIGLYSFPTVEGRSYDIHLNSLDSFENLVAESVYSYSGRNDWVNYDYIYSLEQLNGSYVVGDQVNRDVLKYGDKIDYKDDQWILALFLRNGLLDYSMIRGSEINFEFIDAYRPNILLKAIYFDGENMFMLPKYGHSVIAYDYETLEGEIVLEGLESDYMPGEEINFKVIVTDQLDEPFNGVVNVSVVDEAFFALYEDYFKLGNTLHQYVYSDGILNESTSSDESSNMDGAEAGGGGGDEGFVRDDFVDTAYFENIEIVNGVGYVTMILPDNLTKFRVTLQAVNGNLEYASKKVGFNISLPYFVRSFYNMNYLKGDDVYLPVSSEGDDVNKGSNISYTLKMNNNLIDTYAAIGKEISQLPIGVLEEDTEVTVLGAINEDENGISHKDGLLHNLNVKDYYLEFDFIRTILVSEDFKAINIYADSKLSIINGEARDYQELLYKSFSGDNFRVEEILAREEGEKLLKQYFDLGFNTTYNLEDYQGWAGGIKLLPTSDESIETTAMIAATKYGMTHFDRNRVINYLKDSLHKEKTPVDLKALSLWGLSSLGEPVLLSVDSFLETYKYDELTMESKLYILYALLEMKDKSRVVELSDSFFLDDKLFNMSSKNYILAATLNERLSSEASVFESFSLRDVKSANTINLQKIYYLRHQTFDFSDVSVVYELNGEKISVPIENVDAHVVDLEKGDVFKILDNSDELYVTEQYKVNGLDEYVYKSEALEMSKKYDSDDIFVGDLIPVVLTFMKPNDEFVTIKDQVPAGFEYAGYDIDKSDNVYCYIDHINQKLSIGYGSDTDNGKIVYYIRAIQKGKYKAEPAAIYIYGSGELYMTSSKILEVN